MMLPVLLLVAPLRPPSIAPRSPESGGVVACAGGDARFDSNAWRRAADWDSLSPFERMALLRGLLDGDLGLAECNHAAWRGLGYRIGADGALRSPDGTACTDPPDILADADALASLEAQLPDDEDELAMLDELVDTLHGKELTKQLVDANDREFLARRTLVCWLYLTQPELGL